MDPLADSQYDSAAGAETPAPSASVSSGAPFYSITIHRSATSSVAALEHAPSQQHSSHMQSQRHAMQSSQSAAANPLHPHHLLRLQQQQQPAQAYGRHHPGDDAARSPGLSSSGRLYASAAQFADRDVHDDERPDSADDSGSDSDAAADSSRRALLGHRLADNKSAAQASSSAFPNASGSFMGAAAWLGGSKTQSSFSAGPPPSHPLFQPLLPPVPDDPAAPPPVYIKPERRRFRDLPLVLFYGAAMVFMLAWGFVASSSSPTLPSIPTPSQPPSIVTRVIADSAGLIALLTAISVAAGAAWLALLAAYARPVVMVTAAVAPASVLIVSITSLIVAIVSPGSNATSGEIHAVIGVSVTGLIAAAWLSFYLWRKRSMLETMAHIIELSCDILQLNPSLFVLSAFFTIAHAAFSIFWVYLFSRLFLLGSFQPVGVPGTPGSTWTFVPSSETPLIAIFFILMYFWTSAIFQNLEKTTIASVVGGWYFHDMPESPSHSSDQTWRNFQYVATRSFGTVAFASLVLGFVRTLQFLLAKIKARASRGHSSLAQFVMSIATALSFAIEDYSSYTLVNAGLTGNSFTEAAYACTRLFRRNLVLGLITQGMTRTIGLLGKAVVSAVVGLAVFWRGIRLTGGSGNEWVAAAAATIVPFYVLGVLTHVVENTVDATFICYLIDLDTNSCHCEGAHKIFAESLS